MKRHCGFMGVFCALLLACGGGGGGEGAPSTVSCSGTSYNLGTECKQVYQKVLGCCSDKKIAEAKAAEIVCAMQVQEAACQAGGSTAADAACAQLQMRPECKGSVTPDVGEVLADAAEKEVSTTDAQITEVASMDAELSGADGNDTSTGTTKGWGEPTLVIKGCDTPTLAMNASGNAAVACMTFQQVEASWYVKGTGWQTMPSVQTKWCKDLSIAVSSKDDVVLAFTRDTNKPVVVRYASGTGWGQVTELTTPEETPNPVPVVAMDSAGNSIVIWSAMAADDFVLYVSRYDSTGTGWSNPEKLGTNVAAAFTHDLVMDSDGNAIATWIDKNGAILAARYTKGVGWDAPTQIGQGGTPRVAMSWTGHTMVTWADDSIKVSEYKTGSGWSAATTVATSDESKSVYKPLVAVSGNGNAVVAWVERQKKDNASKILASVYDSTTRSFSTPKLLDDKLGVYIGSISRYTSHSVAMDDSGNAIVVWMHEDDFQQNSIYASYYDASTGWGSPEPVEKFNNNGETPFVRMDKSGNAVVVWRGDHWRDVTDGLSYKAWANTFTK